MTNYPMTTRSILRRSLAILALLLLSQPLLAYYCPATGRFLSRDPIGERGGANVYAFVRNATPTKWDNLGLKDSENCYYVWINILVKKSGSPATPAHAAIGIRPQNGKTAVSMYGTDQQANWRLDQTYDPVSGKIGEIDGRKQGKVYECCCLSDAEFAELESRYTNLTHNKIPEGPNKGKPLNFHGSSVSNSPNGIPYNCGTAVSVVIHGLGGCPTDNIWNMKPENLAEDDDGKSFFNPLKELYTQMEASVRLGKCSIVHNGVPEGNKYH